MRQRARPFDATTRRGAMRRVYGAQRAMVFTLLVGAGLLMSGCGGSAEKRNMLEMEPSPQLSAPTRGGSSSETLKLLGDLGSAASSSDFLAEAALADTVQRQLIRNAEISVEVESVDSAIVRLSAITARYGGYVSSQSRRENTHDNSVQGSIVLRVPAERTDAVLAEIRTLGEAKNERIWTEDVTDEYYDLNIRLRNAQQARTQLEAVLRTANKVTDVLEVRRELSRVTEEIERMTGHLRRMVNQIQFSTITVTLAEPIPMTEDRTTAVGQVVRAFGEMVDIFWATIAGLIKAVGFLVPMAGVVALCWWIVARLTRGWRERRRQAKALREPQRTPTS